MIILMQLILASYGLDALAQNIAIPFVFNAILKACIEGMPASCAHDSKDTLFDRKRDHTMPHTVCHYLV